MTDKLIDKINAMLVEADEDIKREFFYAEIECGPNRWDDQEIVEFKKQLTEANLNFELVDRYGGEEQGSDYWCVWKFSKDGEECFVKFYGYYASHYGSEYQGFKFVTPVQKLMTVYE